MVFIKTLELYLVTLVEYYLKVPLKVITKIAVVVLQ